MDTPSLPPSEDSLAARVAVLETLVVQLADTLDMTTSLTWALKQVLFGRSVRKAKAISDAMIAQYKTEAENPEFQLPQTRALRDLRHRIEERERPPDEEATRP